MEETKIDKDSTHKLYIAYGSNLNLSQMKHRCPTARVIGTSELKDYELVFRGSGHNAVATVEPCKGSTVPVYYGVSSLMMRKHLTDMKDIQVL